ncbi:MAG: hypothetical protein M9928_19855 [Anaerolineae bacterium]|nr:hypothetical protein [Anaerolineae bacterium]MCO5189783.1 hypothetical protein [Anaerolineae bacterium]MCO5207269.1 hypothetical protein [Anaerolineae bacterium]
MQAENSANKDDELRAEYEFDQLEVVGRGVLAERFQQSERMIRLDPDVSLLFPTDESVNEALRFLIRATGQASAASRS